LSIVERIRAHGGDVIRSDWRVSLRPGQLSTGSLDWLRAHRSDLMREVWPEFDEWEERAAIREFDGGMSRADAEAAAYAEVMAP